MRKNRKKRLLLIKPFTKEAASLQSLQKNAYYESETLYEKYKKQRSSEDSALQDTLLHLKRSGEKIHYEQQKDLLENCIHRAVISATITLGFSAIIAILLSLLVYSTRKDWLESPIFSSVSDNLSNSFLYMGIGGISFIIVLILYAFLFQLIHRYKTRKSQLLKEKNEMMIRHIHEKLNHIH